jgi:uncharacterized membrane protein
MNWAHVGPSILASFLASLVECVEALTVVLAVGSVRGWRSTLEGSALAVGVLMVLITGLGRALTRVPLHTLQLVVGILLLLFGLRWLRKAILRSAGQIALHDESAAFVRGWDRVAFATAFQITMLEGTEVVFIVIGIGAGGVGLIFPASLGAAVALLLIIGLGFVLHHPLANVPENKLKFVVGVMLSAFGTFWVGEGAKVIWPGGDWSILGLIVGYLVVAIVTVSLCRGNTTECNSAIDTATAVMK